ncbi:unnamed protein product [Trichobilharzia szidati]|nr:unnamed protein product [Trichobilharzia szidati]
MMCNHCVTHFFIGHPHIEQENNSQDMKGNQTGLFIKSVTPNGLADKSGKLKAGDQLIAVNSISLLSSPSEIPYTCNTQDFSAKVHGLPDSHQEIIVKQNQLIKNSLNIVNNGDNSSTYPDDTHAVRPSDKYDARLHFNCADDEMKALNENATKISSVYPFAARLLKQAYGPVRLSLIRYNSVGERNESQPQQNCHLDISEGTQQHLINISQEDSQDIVTCKTQTQCQIYPTKGREATEELTSEKRNYVDNGTQVHMPTRSFESMTKDFGVQFTTNEILRTSNKKEINKVAPSPCQLISTPKHLQRDRKCIHCKHLQCTSSVSARRQCIKQNLFKVILNDGDVTRSKVDSTTPTPKPRTIHLKCDKCAHKNDISRSIFTDEPIACTTSKEYNVNNIIKHVPKPVICPTTSLSLTKYRVNSNPAVFKHPHGNKSNINALDLQGSKIPYSQNYLYHLKAQREKEVTSIPSTHHSYYCHIHDYFSVKPLLYSHAKKASHENTVNIFTHNEEGQSTQTHLKLEKRLRLLHERLLPEFHLSSSNRHEQHERERQEKEEYIMLQDEAGDGLNSVLKESNTFYKFIENLSETEWEILMKILGNRTDCEVA